MKVDQPNLRDVAFDCPWEGHLFDPGFAVRNSARPDVIGLRCVKCGCLIYIMQEASPIVGADGGALPKATEGGH